MKVVDFGSLKVPLVFGEDSHWTDFPKTEEFLPLIDPINYMFKVSPETTTVKARPVSFYEEGFMLKVQDPTWGEEWKNLSIYFLNSGEHYFQLSSKVEMLTDINEMVKPSLKKHTVLDYVKYAFYFFYLDQEYGSSCLIEGQDSEFIELIPYSNKLEQKRNKEKIKVPTIAGPDAAGGYDIQCDIMVALDMLRAKVRLSKEGFVDIKESMVIIPGNYPQEQTKKAEPENPQATEQE